MSRRVRILIFVVFLGIICPAAALCQQYRLPLILDSLRHYAQLRSATTPYYEASLKVKSEVDVLHRGAIPWLMPYLNKAKLSEGTFTQEYAGQLQRTSEDSTSITLTPRGKENSLIVSEFTEHITSLSMRTNIYSQYIFGNIYSPLAYLSGKYYNYELDSTWQEGGITFHKITFSPKITNYKFVEGYLIASQDNWSVRRMHIAGNVEFVEYNNTVLMGEKGSAQEMFPQQMNFKIKGNFFGSRLNGECIQQFGYTRIGDRNFLPDSTISTPCNTHAATTDTTAATSKTIQRGSFLVKDHTLTIKDKGNLYIAPLVSPLLFHYSTHNGLSYTQKLKYTRELRKDRMFTIAPLIGYNFKYKEFYWAAKGDFMYAPATRSRIFLEAGNGVPQDLRTSYVKLGHTIQLLENISLTATAAQLHYKLLNPQDYPEANPSYTTFAPEVELQLKKHGYPTITAGYAHSIKGIIGSDVEFGRAEFDLQHKIDVGPMHTLTYRAGFGYAFDYNYLYFVQFKNLRNNHLPHGWDDDIGGTFNLLSSVKYNEIDKYLRANVQYDAPLLLVPTLLKRVKYITKERLYCNLLLVDTMNPYLEMGYGIGTNIFNMGIFWGGEVDKWDRIGVKFTFELFNK